MYVCMYVCNLPYLHLVIGLLYNKSIIVEGLVFIEALVTSFWLNEPHTRCILNAGPFSHSVILIGN